MNIDGDHARWMRDALREAEKAFDAGEVPIGAVVVHENRIIGRGHNQVERLNDPTAHAEVIAIGAACETIGDWRLNGAVIYVTAEPCLMCAGAMHWSRVRGLVFGAPQPESGVFGSRMDMFQSGWYHPTLWVERGVLEAPAVDILQRFFEIQRRRSAGVVERGGLENRCAGNRTEGSNPSSSANSGDDENGER